MVLENISIVILYEHNRTFHLEEIIVTKLIFIHCKAESWIHKSIYQYDYLPMQYIPLDTKSTLHTISLYNHVSLLYILILMCYI